MPEMDGLEATRQMRQVESQSGSRRRTHVVALTANAMSGDERICIDAGMDSYLTKTVDAKILAEALGRV